MRASNSKRRALRSLGLLGGCLSLGLIWAASAFAAAPAIEGESVSGLTHTDATLEAEIDTGGLATHYQFRLAYGCGFPGEVCPQFCVYARPCPGPWNSIFTVSLPSADLAPSSGAQHVSLDLSLVGVTLEPYKYRYSVEATNADGSAQGPAQYFNPPPPSSPPPPSPAKPVVQSTWVGDVTTDDATLHATIDPEGLDTDYEFFLYEPCPEPGPGQVSCQAISVLPLPGGSIPASFGPVDVSASAGEAGYTLRSGRKYEWAIRASNEEGQAFPDGPSFFIPSPPSSEEGVQETGGAPGDEEAVPLSSGPGGGDGPTATSSDLQPSGSAPQKGKAGPKKSRCTARKARQSSSRHRHAVRRARHCGN